MHGLHLTADLHGCSCELSWLTEASRLGPAGLEIVRGSGLNVVGHLVHAFPATTLGPGGVTATFLLAESHLCIHTWPEQRAVTLDVYVCNFSGDHAAKAHAVMDAFLALFMPGQTERHSVRRGSLPVAAGPAPGSGAS